MRAQQIREDIQVECNRAPDQLRQVRPDDRDLGEDVQEPQAAVQSDAIFGILDLEAKE